MMLLWIDERGEAKWKEFPLFQIQAENVILILD